MVYITGDTHGYEDRFFYTKGPLKGSVVPEFDALSEEDVLIVAGDFGFVWDTSEKRTSILDRLETLPFTIGFVDGNHENFLLIYSYPKESWCGGSVHRIRKNIVHLIRGESYWIQGKRIFVFGGAASTDRGWRVKNVSWWEQELPTQGEYDNALKSLEKYGGEIDYIVTHTCPSFIIPLMNEKPYDLDMRITAFLADVATFYARGFRRWFFGHWHIDQEFHGGRYRGVCHDLVALE